MKCKEYAEAISECMAMHRGGPLRAAQEAIREGVLKLQFYNQPYLRQRTFLLRYALLRNGLMKFKKPRSVQSFRAWPPQQGTRGRCETVWVLS
eukprot:g11985.t1